MALLLPIIVFAGMYFLILRPQQKRMKEREAMVRAADIGDCLLYTSDAADE